MPPTSMPPPALPQRIAGDLALDLANTISRRGTARETDHLATDGEVLAWAREGGLVGPDFQPAQAPMAELAAQVRELRHAIGEVGAAIALGGEAPPAALRVVGRHAAIALEGATLRGVPLRLDFQGAHRVTGTVAWAALDLLRGPELARLKRCPADDCHWLFIDRTKNASRRWCDMAVCGNRAKKRSWRVR